MCADTSKTMQQCYNFAGRYKGTIIRIKQALNSTGSVVGVAWVTVCWGVMVCVGYADGGDSFPLDICACQTVTSQACDLNILGQQESHIEYIPVCRIVMLCFWASSSHHFEGL